MEMIEVKTEDLTGRALDWAVSLADGKHRVCNGWFYENCNPSTDWGQCGPLVDSHDVDFAHALSSGYWASARIGLRLHGQTRLIAACRAIVAAKLGGTVQVPKELIQ